MILSSDDCIRLKHKRVLCILSDGIQRNIFAGYGNRFPFLLRPALDVTYFSLLFVSPWVGRVRQLVDYSNPLLVTGSSSMLFDRPNSTRSLIGFYLEDSLLLLLNKEKHIPCRRGFLQ